MESSADAVTTFFKQKAELVPAVVAEVNSPLEAFRYRVDLCQKKDACQLLISGREKPLSKTAEDLCNLKQEKIIAAPGLLPQDRTKLESLCKERGIRLVTDDLHNHLDDVLIQKIR